MYIRTIPVSILQKFVSAIATDGAPQKEVRATPVVKNKHR